MARLLHNSPDPYARRYRVAGWNIPVSVCEDHRLMRQLPEFTDWTKARHQAIAREYASHAASDDRMWSGLVDRCLAQYGNGNGVLISGVYREHWPDVVKTDLRTLAREATALRDKSRAHWRASGRSLDTWRVMVNGTGDAR